MLGLDHEIDRLESNYSDGRDESVPAAPANSAITMAEGEGEHLNVSAVSLRAGPESR